MISRVLEKTGATIRYQGMMFKAVDKSVLLYGSERWVVTGNIIKVVEGFHHRVYRRIMGMAAPGGAGGEWEYPPVVA